MRLRALFSLLFVGLLLTLYSAFAPPSYAFTQGNPSSKQSGVTSHEYTIRYFDTEGHVIKIWKGPKAEADKIIERERSIRLRLLIKQLRKQKLLKGATPNIYRVGNCTYPNNYFVLWNDGPLLCFSDNGYIATAIYSVFEIDSGNNSGWFGWDILSKRVEGVIYFSSQETDFPPSGYTWYINGIDITGR